MPSSNEVGDGKYKILRRLAVGGMAELYLAEAASIHGFRKKVVIKRILPQIAKDANYVEMFLDEARLVARLNHPSIVQVFDIGQDVEGVFFTMEYIEGHDLADILSACYAQRRQLTLEEVLAIAAPLAEALHHAHELRDDDNQLVNLIHRDVSPSNVIVTNEGRVKLLDFGVAKSRSQMRATTGVTLKGKFGYMAPEQIHGLELDRRCDVFSYGVVLWELFVGRCLFPGGNSPAVLSRVTSTDAPRPSSVRADLPEALDEVCLRALARDRDYRYSTLRELLIDLDAFAKATATVTTPRTLSNLIGEIFDSARPEGAVPIPAPREGVAREGKLLLPLAAPDVLSSPGSQPVPGPQSHASVLPYSEPYSSHEASSDSHRGSGYTPPIRFAQRPRRDRPLWVVGSVLALGLGVGMALLVSGAEEGGAGEAVPPAGESISEAAASNSDLALVESDVPAESPADAPLEPPAAAVLATDAGAEQAAETRAAADAQPASSLPSSTDSAPSDEATTTKSKKRAEAKDKDQEKDKATPRDKKKSKIDAWDPNSPFAPE
jgi:eukaryotic-like serine/threonine-protein kinase